MRIKFFIAVIFLLSGLVIGATAQLADDSQIQPFAPSVQTVELKLHGIEFNDGVVGFDKETGRDSMFGYGFHGQTYGALPGVLTLSMNCTPATFNPGESNEMTGGTWTLPVYSMPPLYKNPVYLGSFYGHIVSGKLSWEKISAKMYFTFAIDGGTVKFTGATGDGFFEGDLTEPVKGQEEATIEGVFTLRYTP